LIHNSITNHSDKATKSSNNDIFLDIQKLIDQSSNNTGSEGINNVDAMTKFTANRKVQEVIKRIYERENKIKRKLSTLKMVQMYEEVKDVQAKPTISKMSQNIIKSK